MLKMIKFETMMWAILFFYIPIHLLEEAFGNWPLWMYTHHYTPFILSYGHWMAGNIFFYYPFLLIAVLMYHYFGEKIFFIGYGVIIWGIFNFIEHLLFTIIDFKVTPGLFTSIIFLIIGVISIYKYIIEKKMIRIILLSIFMAILYAFVPVLLQMTIGEIFFKSFV